MVRGEGVKPLPLPLQLQWPTFFGGARALAANATINLFSLFFFAFFFGFCIIPQEA